MPQGQKNTTILKTLESKKQALEEIKDQTYKKKNVSNKEASDFLKKYANKKKKK